MLSLAYAQSKKTSEAIEAAGRAVTLGEPAAPALYFAGRAMLEAGRLELADSYLSQAITLSPTVSDAMSELGAVKEKQGKRSEAADMFRRALGINPQDPKAKAGLARVGG